MTDGTRFTCRLPTSFTMPTWSNFERRRKMARKFQELLDKMSPESRARAEARAKAALKEMPLDELRAARELTQEHLAAILTVGQAAVFKMERRSDMYISTLSQFVKAMGGHLEIRAVFPDGEVRISQFKDLGGR